MKKMLLCLVLMCLIAVPALAQTVNVDGKFTVTLPDDMKAVEVTDEDKEDGLLLEMESDALRFVAYYYEPDPSYIPTLDEMNENYLADQQEGFYTSVAIEELGGTRMIVYDTGEGTIGAITILEDGKTYEFIAICEDDGAAESAKAIIESLQAA
jgi:hypothetical protein